MHSITTVATATTFFFGVTLLWRTALENRQQHERENKKYVTEFRDSLCTKQWPHFFLELSIENWCTKNTDTSSWNCIRGIKVPNQVLIPFNFSAFPTLLSPLNLIQFTFAKVVNFTGKCIPFWTTQGTKKRVPFSKDWKSKNSFILYFKSLENDLYHVGRLVTLNQVWLAMSRLKIWYWCHDMRSLTFHCHCLNYSCLLLHTVNFLTLLLVIWRKRSLQNLS